RARFERALRAVGAAHDGLRLRFAKSGAAWSQRYAAEPATIALETWDLSAIDAQARPAESARRADPLQASLALGDGPRARAAWIDAGSDGRRVFLVAHHLIVDGVSWRVLLDDLAAAYDTADADAVRPRTASFQEWSAALEAHARSPRLLAEIPYWKTTLA